MPEDTTMSADRRTRSSLTLQRNRYQGFQPIGGVRASPLRSAGAAGTQRRLAIRTASTAPAPIARRHVIRGRQHGGSRGGHMEDVTLANAPERADGPARDHGRYTPAVPTRREAVRPGRRARPDLS